MDRKDKLLHGIDVKNAVGVEIGALCRPFVTRKDGRVIYVDHTDTASLKEKYRLDPNVDVDSIVDVDAVWGSKPLAESIGTTVDYVVASHVVEHVPDLIAWLRELSAILKPGGEIRLIVPDRRFTFDYVRQETRFTDVLYASMVAPKVPLPHIVLDYVLNVTKVDGAQSWRGEIDVARLERHHPMEQAIGCAQQARDGVYHDVHCWVFTPRSFALLFAELSQRGLMQFECTSFYDTAPFTIEFFVGLRATGDQAAATASWRKMAEACKDHP